MLPDGSDRVSSTPKQQLFDALRLRLGDYLQVEELSSDLELSGGLTRGLLDELSADGAELEHHPGLGYRLGGIADQLLQVEIHYELETQTLGRDLVVRERVESTNDVARELVEAGAGEGTLVVADVQSAGRGRRGRAWFSPPGAGLWCSLVLAAPRDGQDPGFLTLLLGGAIARAIRLHCGLRVRLKWPNDLVASRRIEVAELSGLSGDSGCREEGAANPAVVERKLGGILCELHSAGRDRQPVLIAGFGIDVNLTAFPAGLAATATSILLEMGERTNRCLLLKEVLREIERDYLCAAAGGGNLILQQTLKLSSTLGRRVLVRTEAGQLVGVAEEIRPDGSLVLAEAGGERHIVRTGDLVNLHEGDCVAS